MLRLLSLYCVMVVTSATVIIITLGVDILSAIAAAAVSSVFKTVAATGHAVAWSKFKK
jgi:uncharacterized membrane protein